MITTDKRLIHVSDDDPQGWIQITLHYQHKDGINWDAKLLRITREEAGELAQALANVSTNRTCIGG